MSSPAHRPRLRRARARARTALLPIALTLVAGTTTFLATSEAEASVRGKGGGIEIEGAQDRRGFYVGTGVDFGGTFFFYDDFIPAMRMNVALGGGVTKKLTLGADLHVTPYLAPGVGVGFGGDIEGTFYVWRGFYLRSGLGASGVPRRDTAISNDRAMTVGLGGAFGLGYEFFLNATAAMSAGFTYDARFIPGDAFPRQSLLLGVRFTWF